MQLYVQARMQGKWTRLVRPTIQFFLVAFSLYVGYTRVSDFKHHWSDVLVGLLQGALVAVLTVSRTTCVISTGNSFLIYVVLIRCTSSPKSQYLTSDCCIYTISVIVYYP